MKKKRCTEGKFYRERRVLGYRGCQKRGQLEQQMFLRGHLEFDKETDFIIACQMWKVESGKNKELMHHNGVLMYCWLDKVQ